jgi:hydrogenase nickel incorporation protein HypB
MCGICGCSEEHTHDEVHEGHHHPHHHDIIHDIITVEQSLLAKNNQFATANRDYFLKNNIRAINLMSSPGSGKTTLLTRTLSELKNTLKATVIVGDQQTSLDAEKLKSTGAAAIQVNTGKTCHLDAHMIGHSLDDLSPEKNSLLMIENVGNLVCPALFDLGEEQRVVLLSVPEGDNKPLKYPEMFRNADLMLITKTDLLPYVDFNTDKCIEYARRINPAIKVLSLSTTKGLGLDAWYQWLAK